MRAGCFLKRALSVRSEPVLIGPIGTGKSTLSKIISAETGLRVCALDDCRWNYYEEIGYDADLAARRRKDRGFLAVYHYWKPFEAHAVERALSEHRNGIFDFGAGHSVYEDPRLFQRVQSALAPFPHVILVLPSSNPERSMQVLDHRAVIILNP